jgi:hypothetical protein
MMKCTKAFGEACFDYQATVSPSFAETFTSLAKGGYCHGEGYPHPGDNTPHWVATTTSLVIAMVGA